MIFGKRSDVELKYAKAKAKATEFSVDQSTLPKFKLNSDDLHYPSIFVLSAYANTRLSSSPGDEYLQDLRKVASFYDAASNDERSESFSDGYWLLAMSTYYLLGNYGSAKVAASKVQNSDHYGRIAAVLHGLISYLLIPNKTIPTELKALGAFLGGSDISTATIMKEANDLRLGDSPEDSFFGRILFVSVLDTVSSSARELLPEFTGLPLDTWKPFLSSPKSPKILWQAQKQIGSSGVFAGQDSFIQLPTGSGKTKSMELLLRSRFLSKKCTLAVVVAPLRALCTEIARDLSDSLEDIASVNAVSDALEIDSWLTDKSHVNQVLVLTPEKLSYIIHHDSVLLKETNLFVLDEAHLLASESRGPGYELLLTELFQSNSQSQKVMISAVVSNAEKISSWAFRDSTKVVQDEDIQISEKSLGLIQRDGRRVSFVDQNNIQDESFFILVDIDSAPLKKFGGERKRRFFPTADKDANKRRRDYSIYYANRLLPNGGCAIYVPKRSSLPPLFKRLDELIQRDANISNLYHSIDSEDKQRIINLVDLHYGKGSWIASGIEAGVLPHYGDLQGSIRQAVEYAMEHSQAKCVACTSTLSEGVNLPIKYLIVTGVRKGYEHPKTREFQNLIGRTARSGRFSEGSVLIVDDTTKNKELYSDLINSSNTESCESAILNLLDDASYYKGGLEYVISGDKIVDVILRHISDPHLEEKLTEAFIKSGCNDAQAHLYAAQRMRPLEAIENYISGILTMQTGDISIHELCTATFAYSSSDDTTRERLLRLFNSVHDYLASLELSHTSLFYLMQIGARNASKLINWIESPAGIRFFEEGCTDLELLCEPFISANPNLPIPLDAKQLAAILKLWINNYSLDEIKEEVEARYSNLDVTESKLEKLLSSTIRFSFSHFVSCTIDALRQNQKLATDTNLTNISTLHRKIKYGVSSLREATICERVIDDRMIANQICEIIGYEGSDDYSIIKMEAQNHRALISKVAEPLPPFCSNRLNRWLK